MYVKPRLYQSDNEMFQTPANKGFKKIYAYIFSTPKISLTSKKGNIQKFRINIYFQGN